MKPSFTEQCHFGKDIASEEWVQFENNREINLTINKGKIEIGRSTKFICKTKHWVPKIPMYKTFSLHGNGW